MELKSFITNEKIKKRFVSQFDLVNYAIKLAANMIQTGRSGRVKSDSQNRTMIVLSEILNEKDVLDEIIAHEVEIPEAHREFRDFKKKEAIDDDLSNKAKPRKKPRKIFAE